MQHTLETSIHLSGTGLHSGKTVRLAIHPADVDHGIVFKRVDLADQDNVIPASWDHVVDTQLCTVIGNETGATVGTIEHLMSALRGCGIDNALIEVDAPEVPIMDGSARLFVDAIEEAGAVSQSAPRRAIRVLKEVSYQDGDKFVRLSPSPMPVYSGRIDYDHPDIGVQDYSLSLIGANFKHDVSDCRTFGFLKDVEAMRAAGLALGGSLDNAIVLADDSVINEEGLRCTDEFIRHKVLDAVGDLALAGGPVLGHYHGVKAGHELNNRILKVLFADPEAWEVVDYYVDLDETGRAIYPQIHKDSAFAA